ncbi:hypothetical protein SASPL_119052 [Salvia splendens]|uniref:SMP-LTD domain-containing protein n=1 Tax=Salvia splendens TaxID=180675 RepID=A0A8X8Y2I8_SALSN|nr:hypothetical protein SASPL_119052 [Salvia splendens]
MVLHSSATHISPRRCDFSQRKTLYLPQLPLLGLCSCTYATDSHICRRRRGGVVKNVGWAMFQAQSRINGGINIVLKRFSDEGELNSQSTSDSSIKASNSYSTSYGEDPIVNKLRSQLGVIHSIPYPPINRSIIGLFGFFFFVGVLFDKVWAWRKADAWSGGSKLGSQQKVSLFLEKELQRKESVEWVNMVLGKLWKVYRGGIENWIIGLLQPVIDNLKKPDYVQRVEIKQFSLGDEPLSVRSVERRTSRRANDLHYRELYELCKGNGSIKNCSISYVNVNDYEYQIGLRYTGGARMLLLLSLNFGILPISVPVGVRDFDIDGELWVKLRLIPTEPWVGAEMPWINYWYPAFYILQDFDMLVSNPKKNKLSIEVRDSLGFTDLTVGTAEIDLGSLKYTVPADRIVVLRGEDERSNKVLANTEASQNDLSDSVEPNFTIPIPAEEYVIATDTKSFMNDLAALLVSEEFRGIVASESNDDRANNGGSEPNDGNNNGASESNNRASVSGQQTPANDSGGSQEYVVNSEATGISNFAGSSLFWLAIVTSITVLVALNDGTSGLLNP